MAGNTLENLLQRICEANASPAELARARELLADDARFPEDLRTALDDEPALAAGALLALLGVDDGFADQLASAIGAEAGSMPAGGHADVAADVLHLTHPGAQAAPVADAVHAMAGDVDVSHEVLDQLALDMADVPLAQAVRAMAGEVDIVSGVLARAGVASVLAPVAQAVRAQAGHVEVASAVLAAVELQDVPLPIAAAIAHEAGSIDVTAAVLAATDEAWISGMLDNELPAEARQAATGRLRGNKPALAQMTAFAEMGRRLRNEVQSEAGEVPYLWASIAPQIGIQEPEAVPGWDATELVAAVRAQAGEVDVVDAVMGRVLADRIRTASPAPAIPEPANRPWIPVLAMAAAALFAVAVGGPGFFAGTPPAPGTSDGGTEVAFAQSDEIIINELEYAEDATVQVIQADGENAPLIIWVDEGTTL